MISDYSININADLLKIQHKTNSQISVEAFSTERISFANSNFAFDFKGNAGAAVKVLGAVFGKESVSNKGYVGVALNFLDSNWSFDNLAELALGAAGAGSSTISNAKGFLDMLAKKELDKTKREEDAEDLSHRLKATALLQNSTYVLDPYSLDTYVGDLIGGTAKDLDVELLEMLSEDQLRTMALFLKPVPQKLFLKSFKLT